MKLLVRLAVTLGIVGLLGLPARPQTTGTDLLMSAHWDDGTAVVGTVTLGAVNVTGPDTILAVESISGRASFTTNLAANSFYDVTLVTTTGVQLTKFPFTTAMINPSNLSKGAITLVFRKANNSLKSAQVTVSMNF